VKTRPPALAEALGAVLGVEREQPFASEKENVPHAVHRRGDGRGITRAVVRRLPRFLAVAGVEGDDARSLAADIDQQQLAFHEWSGSHAEESLARLVLRGEVVLPGLVAGLQVETEEPAFRAESVYPLSRDHGRRPRAVALAERVVVAGRIRVLPHGFAGV